MLFDTICAIATPLAMGAISIIRISGPDALESANRLTRLDLLKQKGNTITHTFVYDPKTNMDVDEVLVSVFLNGKSYTGEDSVEINCHGGIYITKKVLTLLLENGCRMARPGEFTQRAFLNGKMDVTQAEAVNELIRAEDDHASQMAMHAIKGSVKSLIEPFLDDLLDIIAQIEVNIDYPEYDDVAQLTKDEVLPKCREWIKDIDAILAKAKSGKIMKEGIKTAIVGKPNVGKSSLLNALLEEDKAIVTDVAGTTRDTVEGTVRLENVTLHLIDTAGIRESEDVIEKIGIEKSKQAIQESELVIVLLDGSLPLDEKDEELLVLTKEKTRIIAYNKKDLAKQDDRLCISALNHDIDALIDKINAMYEEHTIALSTPTLQNERQIALMQQARQYMIQAKEALEKGMELDVVTIDLQAAYEAMKDIIGEASRDDLLDTLFSNFCLGK